MVCTLDHNFMGEAYNARDFEWRLRCTGLPRHLSLPFSQEVEKYLVNAGPAWTVTRLKSLKNDLVREAAGLEPLTWVRKKSPRPVVWYYRGAFPLF
jgi:hypothetical protein